MTFDKPFDRPPIEPGKMNGKPCIRGLRITVAQVLALLGSEQRQSDYGIFFSGRTLELGKRLSRSLQQ